MVMRFMEAVAGLFSCQTAAGGRRRRRLQKARQLETVEMKVRPSIDGCEHKIRKTLEGMDGVTAVEVAPGTGKVTVTGYVDAAKLMRRLARKTGKRVDPWPGARDIDRKVAAPAGAGYVVFTSSGTAPAATYSRASSTEARFAGAFSDENPNAACAVM